MNRCPQCHRVETTNSYSVASTARSWGQFRRRLLDGIPAGSYSAGSGKRRASLLAELDEKEKAIASLNGAAAAGDYWPSSIKYDAAFDSLAAIRDFRNC